MNSWHGYEERKLPLPPPEQPQPVEQLRSEVQPHVGIWNLAIFPAMATIPSFPQIRFPYWNPWMTMPFPQMQNTQVLQQVEQQEQCISRNNTMIIVDIRLALLNQHDASWVAHMTGNISFAQCQELIQNKSIKIDKKYVFIALGSKQVYMGTDAQIKTDILRLVDVIFEQNSGAKIHFLPVQPRLADNHYAKQYIVQFNKQLSAAVKVMKSQNLNVVFLPIQNFFLVNGIPDLKLFEPDKLMFSSAGCRLFKHKALAVAGFKQNVK